MNKLELRQLIREELHSVVNEGLFDMFKKDYRLPPPFKKSGNHYFFHNPKSPKGYEVFFYGGKDVKNGFHKKAKFAYQYRQEDNSKSITIDWLNKYNVPFTETNTNPIDHPDFKDMIDFDARYVEPNPNL